MTSVVRQMTVLPQFPLGLVLFPSMVLPLHVFEPRYRTMVHDVLDGERTFGVVMIERGSDVGGDDQRSDYGTAARVVEAEELPDGRWALLTVGIERFRVVEWLPDDPYPLAEIESWPDSDPGIDEDDFGRVESKFRRCVALASEAGFDTGPLPQALEPGELGTMQMAAMLPIALLDKQKLLGIGGSCERLRAVEAAVDDTVELIELQLREG